MTAKSNRSRSIVGQVAKENNRDLHQLRISNEFPKHFVGLEKQQCLHNWSYGQEVTRERLPFRVAQWQALLDRGDEITLGSVQ